MSDGRLRNAWRMSGSDAASGSSEDQIIIYSNADEEAVDAIEKTLDDNGYEGEYVFQTFGTSELGGKLIAEGKNLEADMVTMSLSTWTVLRSRTACLKI